MLAMRDRLQADAEAAAQRHDRELHSQLVNTSKLSSTMTRLQDAEEQLRTLQATLIAEKVGRTEAERRSQVHNDEVRKFKTELAGAVRALRRAREEAKRGEEERRRVLRGWEEAKER
jgi:tellurite resistance protein